MSRMYPELPLYATYGPSADDPYVWVRKIHLKKIFMEKKFHFYDKDSKIRAIGRAEEYSEYITNKFKDFRKLNPTKIGATPQYPGVFFNKYRSGKMYSAWEATINFERCVTFTVAFGTTFFGGSKAFEFAVKTRIIARWIKHATTGDEYMDALERFELLQEIKRGTGSIRKPTTKIIKIEEIEEFFKEFDYDFGLPDLTLQEAIQCLSKDPCTFKT